MSEGFDLGYEGNSVCTLAKNAKSVLANPEAAREKVESELRQDRLAGPFSSPPFEVYKCTPLSLREKSSPGKFRLLHDLSFPYNEHSVNGNIPDEKARLAYATVKTLATSSPACNPFKAKADLKEAYHQIPISRSSIWLVCFSQKGSSTTTRDGAWGQDPPATFREDN